MRLLADENFRRSILIGLLRRKPDLDIVRVQDVGLSATADALTLAWAAENGRIFVTHDRRTVSGPAWERVAEGKPMPGVVILAGTIPTGAAIQELLIIIACSNHDDWNNQVEFLPL